MLLSKNALQLLFNFLEEFGYHVEDLSYIKISKKKKPETVVYVSVDKTENRKQYFGQNELKSSDNLIESLPCIGQ